MDGVKLPTSPAIVAENAKAGDAWWVTTLTPDRSIEGFADQVSAVAGDTVTLFVNTVAPSFHVEAYRMGYYQGIGGRLVWTSAVTAGDQAAPARPARHHQHHRVPVVALAVRHHRQDWPPGAYLLKLVGSGGQQQFVPLCVRDDSSTAAIVIQHSVTTWQAYNRWGGYSLYYGNADGGLSFTHNPGGGSYADRARVVSFDRPYDHDWASGAADFVGNELPRPLPGRAVGLDVTYWTDVDLHARPHLLTNHRALLSLGHDEYWSAPMRDGASHGPGPGGEPGLPRRQRLLPPDPLRTLAGRAQPAPDLLQGRPPRTPMAKVDPVLTTVNWPDPPVNRPESELIGSTYQDIEAQAGMVITDPGSWLFDGVGLSRQPGPPQCGPG